MQLDKGLTWTGLVVQSHAALLPSQLEIDVPGDVPGLQELPRQSLSVCLSDSLTQELSLTCTENSRRQREIERYNSPSPSASQSFPGQSSPSSYSLSLHLQCI